jgi:hypothetical protein
MNNVARSNFSSKHSGSSLSDELCCTIDVSRAGQMICGFVIVRLGVEMTYVSICDVLILKSCFVTQEFMRGKSNFFSVGRLSACHGGIFTRSQKNMRLT